MKDVDIGGGGEGTGPALSYCQVIDLIRARELEGLGNRVSGVLSDLVTQTWMSDPHPTPCKGI